MEIKAEATATVEGSSQPKVSRLFDPCPLNNDDFWLVVSYAPPESNRHSWDIPLTLNGEKYTYFFNLYSSIPRNQRDLDLRFRTHKFLQRNTQPRSYVWSKDTITAVTRIKKRSFMKVNPEDLYTIVMKLLPRIEMKVDIKEAYLAAEDF